MRQVYLQPSHVVGGLMSYNNLQPTHYDGLVSQGA